ncbi:MAG: hypothetical protein ABEH90_09250 [Halolamina sp.]
MSASRTLLERLDQWLTIERPVTYWSFWAALLRLVPILLVLLGLVAVVAGRRFTLISFAPVPFVFIAATVGYTVREFDAKGALMSVVIALIYSFLLWLTGTGWLILRRPTPMLSAVAVLTFVALLAGFGSPTLHGQGDGRDFEQARRQYRQERDR